MAFLPAGCTRGVETPEAGPTAVSDARPVVAVSLPPLADWVRQVAGDSVQVVTLLPPGASPHTFEPTPRLVQEASRARLVVLIGLGLDDWARRLAPQSGAQVLELGPRVETLPVAEHLGAPDPEQHADGHEHGHPHESGPDPHVWLDPARAAQMVAALTEALGELLPAQAEDLDRRSEQYQAELHALAEELAQWGRPYRGRQVATLHGAFNYLLAACGLPPARVITPFAGQEPSARYLQWLARIARQEGLEAVFAEPQLSDQAARTLAQEIGAQVLRLDPLGDPQSPERDTYVKLLRWNLEQLSAGLEAGPVPPN